ncbi:hypothetical protein NN6n1_04530 [Shinella zoogloeoides]
MPLLITAVGQMFVVLVGGLDLSIGSVVSFTTAILALDLPGYVTIPGVFLLAYVICALFAALAGMFLAGRIVSGDPNVGLLMELDAITAVAIGGTQLSGGVGSLHGTVIGVTVLALLSNGMNLLNITPFVQTAIKSILLMAVAALQSRKKIGL